MTCGPLLHLTRDFPPRQRGGISTAVGGLVSALEAEGITCAVLSFDGYRPRAKGAPPPLDTGDDGRRPVARVIHPGQLDAARAWIRNLSPAGVHCHDGLLWPMARPLGPAVLGVHVLQRAQNRLRGIAETHSSREQDRAVAEAAAVLAPSQWAAEQLRRDHPHATIEVARLGIDTAVVPLLGEPRDRIVFAGRFADVKGIAELTRALPLIAGAIGGSHISVIGGAPENPRAERRWMRALSEACPEVALTGWTGRDQVQQELSTARVALVPSRIETFGMTAAEASLAGAAVVATAIGALEELLGEDAAYVPVNDARSLAGAAVELWRAPQRAAESAARARRRVLALSWPQTVGETIAAYHRAGLC